MRNYYIWIYQHGTQECEFQQDFWGNCSLGLMNGGQIFFGMTSSICNRLISAIEIVALSISIIKIDHLLRMERNTWTKREDECLINVIQSLGPDYKWKDVDDIMKETHGIHQKSPKKCRERYASIEFRWNSRLNPQFNTKNWSVEEEKLILRLQDQLGNRWSTIKQFFNERTDIFLKNQFYAVFRKALRKINIYITHVKKRSLRQFSAAIMNSVLTVNEMRFQNRFGIPQEIINLSQEIKQIIIKINNPQSKEMEAKLIQSVIEPMMKFKEEYCPKNMRKIKNLDKNVTISISERQEQIEIPLLKQENFKGSEIKTEEYSSPMPGIFYTPIYPHTCIQDEFAINLCSNVQFDMPPYEEHEGFQLTFNNGFHENMFMKYFEQPI